jgi:2-dehydro-3-deoxyglucarate aldolase
MVATKNRLAEELDADEAAYGASTGLHSPTVVEIFGELGLDYVFVDFEHSGPAAWNTPTLESLSRAADAADIGLIVRLPSGDPGAHPPLVRKVVDAGVRNVVIPRVESATEVRRAVAATRFEYEGSSGDRGVGVARGSSWGGAIDERWFDDEDRVVSCGIMIENQAAMENIDDILAVPGLAFAFIGSMDLSVSLGRPAVTDHDEFRAAVRTVQSACASAGVPFGQMGVDPSRSAELVEQGAQLVTLGSDLGVIRDAFGERLGQVHDD